MEQLTLHIKPRPPFRLDLTVWALRRQPHNKIDLWNGQTYTRIFLVAGKPVKVEVKQEGKAPDPWLSVLVSADSLIEKEIIRKEISSFLEKTMGIDEDVKGFYRIAEKDPKLGPLAERFIGLKPPRFPSVFEAIINAFACQQLSLNVGITLLNRLSETYGAAFRDRAILFHAFPKPEELANAETTTLRSIGFSRNKGHAIITLARNVLERKIDLESLASLNDQEAVKALQEIAGIGRWSAEYVLLRGLRRLTVFPGDDVGAQNNLQLFLSLKDKPDYAGIKRIMRRWEPYQGFIYFHFLLHKLWSKGFVADATPNLMEKVHSA